MIPEFVWVYMACNMQETRIFGCSFDDQINRHHSISQDVLNSESHTGLNITWLQEVCYPVTESRLHISEAGPWLCDSYYMVVERDYASKNYPRAFHPSFMILKAITTIQNSKSTLTVHKQKSHGHTMILMATNNILEYPLIGSKIKWITARSLLQTNWEH